MDRRHFLGGLATAAIGIAALSTIPGPPDPKVKSPYSDIPSPQRRRDRFVNVPLITHEGREVRFYDDLLKDRTVVLNMLYTVCTAEAICPLGTANLVKVQRILGRRMGKDIFFYSITLDPENDTQSVMKAYAKAFKVGPGWEFLTGRKEDIERLRRNLGYVDPDPVRDSDPSQHSGMIRIGIEPLERWGGCPVLSRPGVIADAILRLEPGRLLTAA
ncbi:MAG: SCO family protein [Thermodesulfobacteriota bacterium]